MSVYSFENKKSVPLRVLSFHFAVGKMKTAIQQFLLKVAIHAAFKILKSLQSTIKAI